MNITWRKVQSGTYQAEGTTVQVIKRDDVAECWEVTYVRNGVRLHAQQRPTMREAKSTALGFIRAETNSGETS